MMKEYANKEITVVWQADKCIHSAVCVKGLPTVFNTLKRPWINVDTEESAKIISQVGKCPSGALSIKEETPKSLTIEKETIIADNKPSIIELEPGKNYAWCACGRSSNQPWCDGSHSVTSIKPMIFKLNTPEKAALCMCKQSKNKPFCDGTHNHLT